MFANLKIASRIVLLAGVLATGIVLVALQGGFSLNRVSSAVDELLRREFRLTQQSDLLRGAIGNLRRYEKDVFINIASAGKVGDYQGKWNKALEEARKAATAIHETAGDDRQKDLASRLSGSIESYAGGFGQVAGAVTAGRLRTTAEANEAMEGHKAAVRGMEDLLRQLAESIDAAAHAREKQVGETIARAGRTLVAAVLAILAAGILISLFVARSIIRPVGEMGRVARAIAERRDLTLRIPDCGRNEIGDMAGAIQSMVDATRRLIDEARRNADESSLHAGQMREIAAAVTEASARQSEATASSAAAIEEFTVSLSLVSDTSENVRRDSLSANAAATSGAEDARRTAEEIREIARSISQASEVMSSLSRRSQEIGGIVGVIKDIADQTNLLALNAAIEAARAGETGRGFAVVADEVRKLAERTAQATAEISQMIGNVQTDTVQANSNMQAAHARVDQGVASTLKLVASLEDIGRAAGKMVGSIAEISDALKEQGSASTEIAQKVEQITQMSEENNQAARSAHAHSGDLHELSVKLKTAIGQFVV